MNRILKILLGIEFATFFLPWLSLIPALDGTLFPEGFYQYGWIYSVFALMAAIPTLLIYIFVDNQAAKIKPVNAQNTIKEAADDDQIIKKIPFMLVLAFLIYYLFTFF